VQLEASMLTTVCLHFALAIREACFERVVIKNGNAMGFIDWACRSSYVGRLPCWNPFRSLEVMLALIQTFSLDRNVHTSTSFALCKK
jgi:hypothetical protein